MSDDVIILVAAVVADLLFGEPPARVHPVVWMGRLQKWLRARAPALPAPAFAWGALMALAGPLVFGGGTAWLLGLTGGLVRALVAIYLLKSAFAMRALGAAALRVRRALDADDLPAARAALGHLVSRDTASLDASLIAAAAVESVAENASDSIVAPLFFYAIGGVPAAIAYRAINTLDSMIGYRGDLEWLGKCAARVDDAANIIPARLTALLVIATARLGDGSPARAFAVWRRDRARTESPNAGHPMAAMAGALGITLEKAGVYRLGGGLRAPVARDITRAVRVLGGAAALAVVLVMSVVRGS
ncbi:MAG TPA: adenosylcobinamide-phosphate synthase CbiB [Polyangia bacterium]|nr:adenosylcobinamide-phosphate synthase CbiB [Polyangia bacterium]